jgi:hypothetical protein
MASDIKILFIDTNAFLQVRDLKDLPWRDLFPKVRAIDLMIAHCVIEELDQHKTATNQRRRDRARAALKLIEQASSCEPDLALVLKDNPVRVRIVISRAPSFDWAAHPNLDPANPDDQLIGEAASFGAGAEVFSQDTGPRIRARTIAKIPAYGPRPDWLLPDEQTDDRRKIARLERELERALSRNPRITAGFDKIDEAASEIRVIRPVLHPLHPLLAGRLSAEYLASYPYVSVVPTTSRLMSPLLGVSESEAQRYRAEYSSFEQKVYDCFATLHETVRRFGRALAIEYFVRNESGVAAEGLRIEFDLEGAGWLLASRDDAYIGSLEIPEPPKEPRSFLEDLQPIRPYAPALQPPRDPVAFYWVRRPRIGETHSALQCQDFRPMRVYHDCMFVLPSEDLLVDLVIRLHVSATNLPRPINVSAKIVFAEQRVEWADAAVQAMLPDFIRIRMA